MGDEEWMYFCGTPYEHGAVLDAGWQLDKKRYTAAHARKGSSIGLLRWKAGRLLGLHAPLYETIELALPDGEGSANQLRLNARTWSGGSIRGEIYSRETKDVLPGYAIQDCIVFDGDELSAPLRWNENSRLPPDGHLLGVRLQLERAAVYGFEAKAGDNRPSLSK